MKSEIEILGGRRRLLLIQATHVTYFFLAFCTRIRSKQRNVETFVDFPGRGRQSVVTTTNAAFRHDQTFTLIKKIFTKG